MGLNKIFLTGLNTDVEITKDIADILFQYINKNNLFLINNYENIKGMISHKNVFRCVYFNETVDDGNYIFCHTFNINDLNEKIRRMSNLIFILYKDTKENWMELIKLITYKKKILIYLYDKKRLYYIKNMFDICRIFNK